MYLLIPMSNRYLDRYTYTHSNTRTHTHTHSHTYTITHIHTHIHTAVNYGEVAACTAKNNQYFFPESNDFVCYISDRDKSSKEKLFGLRF